MGRVFGTAKPCLHEAETGLHQHDDGGGEGDPGEKLLDARRPERRNGWTNQSERREGVQHANTLLPQRRKAQTE